MSESCIHVPEILLPVETIDLNAWAVIACDQHTSDQNYWDQLDRLVGNKPSTLRLTLPEIYLNGDYSARIAAISSAMRQYRENGLFRKLPKGFILVQRKTPYVSRRTGLVLAVDLEAYSYEKESDAPIRATERTIMERIPPRLKIREAADLEFPHTMLLYDDPENIVLRAVQKDLPPLYDFELNMGGGHISGQFIENYEAVLQAFDQIVQDDGLLFMVGDGNHSLATAKTAWEKLKPTLSEEERKTHPARYALCEAVNVHYEGIYFEAIHRVVKGVDPQMFLHAFKPFGQGNAVIYVKGNASPFGVSEDVPEAVAKVDEYIQRYIGENGGSVDYIHGEEALKKLTAENSDCVGICLPKMNKADLFRYVKTYGSLPRKTFSMGESEEKRYYVEGKEIR